MSRLDSILGKMVCQTWTSAISLFELHLYDFYTTPTRMVCLRRSVYCPDISPRVTVCPRYKRKVNIARTPRLEVTVCLRYKREVYLTRIPRLEEETALTTNAKYII